MKTGTCRPPAAKDAQTLQTPTVLGKYVITSDEVQEILDELNVPPFSEGTDTVRGPSSHLGA